MERQMKLMVYLLATLVADITGQTPDEVVSDAEKRLFADIDLRTAEEQAVEEIYKAYPSTDRKNGNRNLGKCSKNKAQIRTLLKSHDKEYILYQISRYIQDCEANDTYMKNFGTFLNNLPEYSDDEPLMIKPRSKTDRKAMGYANLLGQ